MKKIHAKLVQKYPRYHNWHQIKHYNKIHWGIFGIYIISVFLTAYSYQVSAYDAAGNESAQTAPATAVTQSPPSSCDTSLGNSAICLKPAPPALPLAGESYTDSVLGTTIYRVTDPSIATNGAGTNDSAQDSMWNKDGTLFYLHHTNDFQFFYSIDRATNVITKLGSTPNIGPPDYYNLRLIPWDPNDPNTLYGIVPSTIKRQLWQYTITSISPLTFSKTLLHDFSTEVPTGGYPYGRVHISPDSRYFAVTISTTGGQDTYDYVVVWDRQTDTSQVLDIKLRSGHLLHSLDGFDGRYLLLQTSDGAGRYIWDWTTDTLSDPLVAGTPDCFGGHISTHIGGVISPGCEGGSWVDRSYATPHTFSPIFSWPKKDNKIDWFNDSHSSRLYGTNPLFFAQSRYVTMFFWGTFNLHSGSIYKLAGYKAISLSFDIPEFFRYKGLFLDKVFEIPAAPNQWYYDTLSDTVYVWLPDSSNPQLSRAKIAIFDWRPLMEEIVQPIKQSDGVWSWRRLAHHRMNYDGTFSTSPLANMDPTGSYILFNSNWDGTLENTDGSSRKDVFMLLVPPLATTPDTTSPSTPTNLTATAVSSTQINLSWNTSTDNVGVIGYKIYRNGVLLSTMNSQLLTYQDTGLQPSTTYTYSISAYDAAGNESGQSALVTAVTQTPPSSCDSSLGNTAICPKPVPAPPLPAAGGSYTDPTFGTKIIRVTDEQDGVSGQALYSYYSPFNKDSSLFVIQMQLTAGGPPRLFLYGFDKATETISKIRMFPLSPVILQTGIHWSLQSPNILYGLSGIKLYQYDTTANNYTALKDFTSICPSASCSTWQLSKSYEDRYFAFTLKDATQNYKDIKAVVWDKTSDQTYELDIEANFSFYDESRLDQGGKWLLVRGISRAGVPQQRSLFWEFASGRILTAPDYIGHYGADFGGIIGVGALDTSRAPGHRRTDLNDFSLSKDVFYYPKKDTRQNYQISDHISVLPAPDNNPPYAFDGSFSGIKLTGFILDSGFIYKKSNANTSASTVSFPPEAMSQNGRELVKVNAMPTGPGQWYLDTGTNAYYVWPYDNADLTLTAKNVITVMDWFPATDEIFQIWTDGSLKFRRLAHHRSGVWDYASSPRGAISPDGNYFVYTSNFDGMTNVDGIPRTDAFILVVPPLATTPDTTSPSTPTNSTATAISSSQINLSWIASTDDVGVAGYKIYRNGVLLSTINSQLLTYQDTGLQPSTTYTYTVSAYDAAGNESAKSQLISATTLSSFKQSDLNQDGKTDQLDFDILKQDFNRTDKPSSDLNKDGIVDSSDLGILMSGWSP